MTTAVAGPAYAVYNRKPIPEKADALSAWLGVELQTIQRAIPVRFTKTVTAAYTLLTTDDVLLVDATAGPITITWPDPTRAQHFNCTVKKIDASANAVTFASTIASTATAATFDGVTSPTLVSRWDSREYRSNGVQYYQKVAGVVAIFTGSVPAANVTSGTFGSATSDAGTYAFSHAVTVAGTFSVGAAGAGTLAVFGSTTPSADNGVSVIIGNSNAVRNWKIAANTFSGGALDFVPSTVNGGFTFTTPILTLFNSAITTAVPLSVITTDQSTARVSVRNSTANRTWSMIAGQDGVANTSFQIKEMIGGVVILQSDNAGFLNLQSGAFASSLTVGTTLGVTGLATFGGTIRSQGRTIPASGAGVEIDYVGTVATFRSYDRTGSAYGSISLNDTVTISASGLINGQTISSAANFTGSLAVGTTLAVTGATAFSKEARLQNTTVAGLTAAATAGAGATAYVTDSTLGLGAGLGLAVIGGGANGVPCYSDGAAWRIG